MSQTREDLSQANAFPDDYPNTYRRTIGFDCPICVEYLVPPIYHCFNGHPICSHCENKIDKCPICRDKLPKLQKIRNLFFDNFVKSLDYECKKKGEGCQAKLKFDEIDDHFLNCQFSEMPFCKYLKIDCDFILTKQKIIDHLKTHDISGVSESEQSRNGVELDQEYTKSQNLTHVKWAPHFLKFDSKLFFVTTSYLPLEKAVSWQVAVAGSSSVARGYIVRMNLKAPRNPDFETSWTGSVTDYHGKFEPDFSKCTVPLKTLALFNQEKNEDAVSWIIRVKISEKNSTHLEEPANRVVLHTGSTYEKEVLMTTPQTGRLTTFYDNFESERRLPAVTMTSSERVRRPNEYFTSSNEANQIDPISSLVRFRFE